MSVRSKSMTLGLVLVVGGCAAIVATTSVNTPVTTATVTVATPIPTAPVPTVTTAPPTAVPTTTAFSPIKPTCEVLGRDLGQSIVEGTKPDLGMQYVRGAAVTSPDFVNVYFIAVEFSAAGIGNHVAVFASNSLKDGGGIVMSVDDMAKQFTVWPDASKTDAAIRSDDPTVDKAIICLK